MRPAPATSVVRWPVLVLLAAPALAAALVVTFAADHSARFGLVVLGGFAIATALASAIGAAMLPAGSLRRRLGIRAGLAAAGGAVSLSALAWALGPASTAPSQATALAWVTAGTLLSLAVMDALTWRALRGTDRTARDWAGSAILHAVAGLAPLAVPANFLQPYVVRDKDVVLPLELTASIMMVGITGAVLAILGIHLLIAGLSLLPSRRAAQPTTDQAVHA